VVHKHNSFTYLGSSGIALGNKIVGILSWLHCPMSQFKSSCYDNVVHCHNSLTYLGSLGIVLKNENVEVLFFLRCPRSQGKQMSQLLQIFLNLTRNEWSILSIWCLIWCDEKSYFGSFKFISSFCCTTPRLKMKSKHI